MSANRIIALRLGRLDYGSAWRLQQKLAGARRRDEVPDLILVTEHPPTITFGRGGGQETLLLTPGALARKGVAVHHVDRGGQGTFHGPGQVVMYPIFKLPRSEIFGLVSVLEQAVINALGRYNIGGGRDPQNPGVWYRGDKIAALGLAYRDGVTSHGVALNVSTDLSFFSLFTPCGITDRGVTSMERVLGGRLNPEKVLATLVLETAAALGRDLRWGFGEAPWISAEAPPFQEFFWVWDIVEKEGLQTVCNSAQCPNLGECFSSGTATFMILGDYCTRRCAYCSVPGGRPLQPDPGEPERLARAAERLKLDYIVVTSVCRDDLPDGGAAHFASCIAAVRRRLPGARVEVLVPDFNGKPEALAKVIDAGPDVFNHNIETVPRLFRGVRAGADYKRSLEVLRHAAREGLKTKSGLMLGLGETRGEVLGVLEDLHLAGCEMVTLGQYMAPSENNIPVSEYVHPREFEWYREEGLRIGFRVVESGPLVRSSYRAEKSYGQAGEFKVQDAEWRVRR
ncbi:MAG: lipoyl synthase [Bacillota bacterium]